MQLLLAIDGGGSKTVALLARTGGAGGAGGAFEELGRGHAAGCNDGGVLNARPLESAIEAAFHAAGLPRTTVAAACLAIAGAGRASFVDQLRRWAGTSLAARTEVLTDIEPLLVDAPRHAGAIALVAGTGSIAWGLAADGSRKRAGGLGPQLGDEGSGFWVGREAMRAVALAHDQRGPATSLAPSVLAMLQLDTLSELPSIANSLSRPAIAALAPLVFTEADTDTVAGQIAHAAGEHLAELVASVAHKLTLPSLPYLSLAGGLLVHSAALQRRVLKELARHELRPEIVQVIDDPANCVLRCLFP